MALLGPDGRSGTFTRWENLISKPETYGSAHPRPGRTGTTDEIAKAVAFIASDPKSYITGSELFVDGGQGQI
jgi:NAD(P)-dependent dehydrogenase (short-subunit alcohol dehydrogenase family)